MKTVLFIGSPRLFYQEPRRIPTYMAAIIRRHRFTIIVIICISVLMTFSWHFRRKEKFVQKSTSVSYVNENFNDEIHMFDLDEEFFLDIIKNRDNARTKTTQYKYFEKIFEYQDIPPFIPQNIKDEPPFYQTEDFIDLITTQEEDVFTTKVVRKLENKSAFTTSNEEIYTKPAKENQKTEITSPSKGGSKHLPLKEISSTLNLNNKSVSFSGIQPPEDGVPPPYQDNKWAKKEYMTTFIANDRNESKEILSRNTQMSLIESNVGENPVLLIDTPGCKIPKLDPWDPTVTEFIYLLPPYVCPGRPVFMISSPGGSITLNKTVLEVHYDITPGELNCTYQPIYRKHEEEGEVREDSFIFGNKSKLQFGVPIGEDFVNASCNIKGKHYEQYLPLIPLKEDVEKERNSAITPDPLLNVILLGIDSVSKLNFERHFRRTRAFLNERLKSFEMNGYTKVADNTFPNLVPLLTGEFVEHWWNETVMDTMFFDDIGLIWKDFAKRGYRTLFAEDAPFSGTFNYFKRGFYDPPTDYYFRPFSLAVERWKFTSRQTKLFCLNSQLDYDILFDYLKVFAQTMDTRPFFGFIMASTITHDEVNFSSYADEPTKRLLEGLLDSGALNNTLLVLFSDHGMRYGGICETYIGRFEERLPLMYIHVPKWYLDQHPEKERNLQANQDRLMTLLDVHATMIHLLEPNKSPEERSNFTLGTSLFEEITPYRTCPDAYIETHWCPCQLFDIVDKSSLEAINASRAIVEDINSKLEPYGEICEVLEVDKILDARVGKANELVLKYWKTENEVINRTLYVGEAVPALDDYMMTVVAKPGGGVFAGTVRHNLQDNSYSVQGINRISMYRNTSWCINSQKMKLFCYCKIQQVN